MKLEIVEDTPPEIRKTIFALKRKINTDEGLNYGFSPKRSGLAWLLSFLKQDAVEEFPPTDPVVSARLNKTKK
jgi:hypothetical protein